MLTKLDFEDKSEQQSNKSNDKQTKSRFISVGFVNEPQKHEVDTDRN